jgi:hypothetical protein
MSRSVIAFGWLLAVGLLVPSRAREKAEMGRVFAEEALAQVEVKRP